jgi:hypothetical protein
MFGRLYRCSQYCRAGLSWVLTSTKICLFVVPDSVAKIRVMATQGVVGQWRRCLRVTPSRCPSPVISNSGVYPHGDRIADNAAIPMFGHGGQLAKHRDCSADTRAR